LSFESAVVVQNKKYEPIPPRGFRQILYFSETKLSRRNRFFFLTKIILSHGLKLIFSQKKTKNISEKEKFEPLRTLEF